MNDHGDEAHRDDVDPGSEVPAAGNDCVGCCCGEAEARVTATLVPEDKRMGFLPRQLAGQNLAFEFGVYDTADSISVDYDGGFWEFYELSNGGFYIAQNDERRYRLQVDTNGYAGECSADALGIICSLFSINTMLWIRPTEHLNTKYYALYDYAAQHPEAATIFGAID